MVQVVFQNQFKYYQVLTKKCNREKERVTDLQGNGGVVWEEILNKHV